MYSREYLIQCIEDYAKEYTIEPYAGMSKKTFEMCSMKKAGFREIIFEIEHSNDDVIDVVQSFVDHTMLYSRKGKFSHRKMFEYMHTVGENVLDFLYAMNIERRSNGKV